VCKWISRCTFGNTTDSLSPNTIVRRLAVCPPPAAPPGWTRRAPVISNERQLPLFGAVSAGFNWTEQASFRTLLETAGLDDLDDGLRLSIRPHLLLLQDSAREYADGVVRLSYVDDGPLLGRKYSVRAWAGLPRRAADRFAAGVE